MRDTIRTAGIIGYGNAGKQHWEAYHEAGLDVLTYEPGGNLEEVLSCDVVSICSPDDTHVDYADMALDRGASILIEKPISHGPLGRFCDLGNVAEGEGRTVECHFPLRYHQPFVDLIAKAMSGEFGALKSMAGIYQWGRPEKLKGWRGKVPNWSLMVAGGIHLIDLMLWMLPPDAEPGPFCGLEHDMETQAHTKFGDTLFVVSTNSYAYCPHAHQLQIAGDKSGDLVANVAVEVDKQIGVKKFLEKVRNGEPGNWREAVRANEIAIRLAEAARR